ncbi:MAG: L,D-transpeptidase [Oscillospiraceae bacterium]|nr:L,D-transpeptidase [Oscillospiraceae bacterium]
MKRLISFFLAASLTFLLFSGAVYSLAAFEDYGDVTDHWARGTLEKAYNDGLIVGYEKSMFPDGNISAAHVLTFLCRMLRAETAADISGMGLSGDEWYYNDVAKAVHLGILSSANAMEFDVPISRRDAFYMLAEAFQLVESKPDMSVLENFPDTGQLTGAKRRAWASLVSKGIVQGIDGMLCTENKTTRAEFLTVAYRVAEKYLPSLNFHWDVDCGAVLHGSAKISGSTFSQGVWFDCAASDISLRNVRASSVVIRSHSLDSLIIDGSTYVGRMVLAAQSGDISVSPEGDAYVETLVVGTGKGTVGVKGAGSVEVTGRGRYVVIADNTGSVIVSGANNTVRVMPGAHVGRIDMLANADGSRIIADGEVGEIATECNGAILNGTGHVDTITLRRAGANITVKHDERIDNIDPGIEGATVRIDLPDKLPVGDTLNASATIENATPGKVCSFAWYINDAVMAESSITTGEKIPELEHTFEYKYDMPDSAVVSVVVKYVTELGEQHEISGKAAIMLENYDSEYWMRRDQSRILEKVTVGYKGNFTLQWALENDLEDFEKEIWVNAKGYSSASEYLLWINLAYQRVNIFKGTAKSWKLIRSCLVGTGAPGRGTATGVCTTTYKQRYGWTTSHYTCRPVVRFRDGTGYAFHSRLYYPNSDKFVDTRIGFPISNGCIRMYDEDIWFIFDNIPNGTTVVIH